MLANNGLGKEQTHLPELYDFHLTLTCIHFFGADPIVHRGRDEVQNCLSVFSNRIQNHIFFQFPNSEEFSW